MNEYENVYNRVDGNLDYAQEYMIKCRQYDELQKDFDKMSAKYEVKKEEEKCYLQRIEEQRTEIKYLKAIIKAYELGSGEQIL